MIICENFKKCQDSDLECYHKYPHESCVRCAPVACDQGDGKKLECLEIVLKRKGEKE